MVAKMGFKKNFIAVFLIALGFFLISAMPARAEMVNNLSNEGCKTCHVNYPGIKTGSQTYDVKHKFTNCQTCHTTYVAQSMWNCRYCHNTIYQGRSGFRSYSGPLQGYPLGTGEFMDDHGYRVSVDAAYTYHNNTFAAKHNSVFSGSGCTTCHKSTISAEHDGKNKVVANPVEDFEDDSMVFNFGGDWLRVTSTPRTGVYCFKSGAIGHSASSNTQFSISLDAPGTLTFWYRVSSEANYDKLFFTIDGIEKLGGKSGVIGWTQVSYPLTAGNHTLQWRYAKDSSAVYGEDCAKIDDISITGASTTYAFDCNTCHLSSQPAVKNAITANITSCAACHPGQDHEAVHAGSVDKGCQDCHRAVITQEHINNFTTSGRKYDCATCHAAATKEVIRAIASDNLNCAACHKTGHQVGMAAKVPEDIPLWNEYTWSIPMEADVLGDDVNAPAGYATGQVVISNRGRTQTATDILNYYSTQLTARAWALMSGESASGSILDAEFGKENRYVRVRCYPGETWDINSPPVNSGLRIELWYK